MKLTPDEGRVRHAATEPHGSNITGAEFDRFIAKTKADAKRELLEELASAEVSEWARKRVEDELVEWRDEQRFMMRRNGLTIRNQDGSSSDIIRFGFEMAWAMCLREKLEGLQ